jgi:hypothetical protein
VTNFGWPCYEGAERQGGYDGANLNVCENLYAAGAAAVANPYYAYNHNAKVVTGESCPSGGSSTAGLAFYPASGGSYPAEYQGALFFADYTRDCIWAMRRGAATACPTRPPSPPRRAGPPRSRSASAAAGRATPRAAP